MSNKKQEASTALVEAETKALAVGANLDDWGQNEMTSRDVIIPKILAMQGLSDFVTEGKAKIGDFVDSLTGEVIGSIDKPLKFIPFHMEKVWIISARKIGDAKFEFVRYEPVTAENMNYPMQKTVGNEEIKYEYTLQYYVLRPEDTAMPYVISFKSTSLRSGKVLSTQMYIRNKAAGLVPPAYVMELGGKKEKNDKGTFVVMEVKPTVKTSDALIAECLNWFKVVKVGGVKVAAEKPASENYSDEQSKF